MTFAYDSESRSYETMIAMPTGSSGVGQPNCAFAGSAAQAGINECYLESWGRSRSMPRAEKATANSNIAATSGRIVTAEAWLKMSAR